MKPIKKRWHMWKHYTSKYDKALHAAMAALATLQLVGATITPSWASWIAAGVFTWLTCTLILKDTWRETYLKTEPLRSLGAHVGEALHTYTFVKMANVRGTYSIEPDLPAIDPDVVDDDIYTDEIIIRRGMTLDGDPLIASSIPEELSPEIVIGMLEHVKLEYTYDSLGNPYE
jgi:hypothetical protein